MGLLISYIVIMLECYGISIEVDISIHAASRAILNYGIDHFKRYLFKPYCYNINDFYTGLGGTNIIVSWTAGSGVLFGRKLLHIFVLEKNCILLMKNFRYCLATLTILGIRMVPGLEPAKCKGSKTKNCGMTMNP